VADELRAPLSSILAEAELLLKHVDTLDPHTVREMVFAIRGSTIGMVELVENLLCASSIRAGRCALQPRACGPRDLLTEVQLLTAPMLHPLRQGLRLVVRGRIPGIAADPRRIGQVLLNLISNASKVAPREQSIDLTLSTSPDRVRFTVGDRGPGLPPGVGKRLFDPGQGDHSAVRAGGEGIGLGLPIARAIVEMHGGWVGARNRRGGGAAVWFELPTAPRLGLTARSRGAGLR